MPDRTQLLSAPIKLPIRPANEKEKDVFKDKPGADRNGYFYHFELTSGQAFVGYLDTEVREAFFRPVNNLDTLSNLREVYYFSKYFYNKPELMCRVVLANNCPPDETMVYSTIFDSRSRDLFDSERSCMENHALGQMAAKMFGPLCEMEYAKKLSLSAQKKLHSLLSSDEKSVDMSLAQQRGSEGR